MTAVPELKTHWRLGKGRREEGKLYPTCLKTSITFWWSREFIRVTFKRINTEHWIVLSHGYGQADGNMPLLQKCSQTGWERSPVATCGWGHVPPGSLKPPSPSPDLPAPPLPLLFRCKFASPSPLSSQLSSSISSPFLPLFPLSCIPEPFSTFFTGYQRHHLKIIKSIKDLNTLKHGVHAPSSLGS